ncbi:3-beta hydroxysteroid dehydrogenase/isomerase family-domain-containing protein [Catenaria anguillulae PL171]|uniref:3-beta hydroxysteroid dehydrogenase/isomerase family-domain-containing protein n=1 Tax=Catenaria anguillulae PL171 TaxID=765915 RepID=A0A1Y2HB76_9FUNG|nr:3-beta hydroxysteroid dehydrogenase/isomerase family-domain-containing protein [Catenaria anguillulae PL171]
MAALQSVSHPVLVVGGDGFLGSHVVEYLLACSPPSTSVHILDIAQRSPPRPRVQFHVGTLLDHDALVRVLQDNKIATVIHTASPPHGKSREFMWSVNVDGTKNLVQACLKAGVTKFVFTSSSSVVFEGQDLINVNEDMMYAQRHLDAYTETKAIAEDLVLKSNNLPTTRADSAPLLTVALRPSAIYGPRDAQQLPRLVDNIVAGKSHVAIGDGINKSDFTYVENIAYAHVLAAAKLGGAPGVAGNAFFITDDNPIPFWNLNKCLVRTMFPASDPRVDRASTLLLPRWLMLGVAYLLSAIAWVLRPARVKWEPLLHPTRVVLATATRTFDISKAKTVLGYRPLFTMEEGMTRSVEWIKSDARWASRRDFAGEDAAVLETNLGDKPMAQAVEGGANKAKAE